MERYPMNSLDRLEANTMAAMASIMDKYPYVAEDHLDPEKEDVWVGGYDAFRVVLQWIEEERQRTNGGAL